MINVLEYLEQTLTSIDNHDKPAFIGEDETLTFAKLSNAARAIGSFLYSREIHRSPVAVFMGKSPAMIGAFLGVVYGGNYYVPLDAEMPAFRIKLILETLNPPLLICDDVTAELARQWELSYPIVTYTEAKTHPIDENALAGIRRCSIDTDPLYVVFTSGSTGIPKGVVACHRSVIDYIENFSQVLGVTSDTVFGNQSPLYLDACLKEIYPTLKFGASTYLIPRGLFMFPVKLIEYINERGINTICWVASALGLVAGLGALAKNIPYTLHTVAFGSEVFPIKHFNRWHEVLPNAKFIHLYGPTEATGMSTYYVVDRAFGENESIPIGRPFPNTEIVLLDVNDNAPKKGEAGEICIRGTGLSLGYFGDITRTQNVFMQNPLSAFPDIIYKTGDLGRYGENGELYFISRKDHQIKHMGHRIELAEIEWLATRFDGIEMVCAVFDDTPSHIVLYYLARQGIEKRHVMEYLKANLPRYMMPHAIFELAEIPLTPGGKCDRVGLLAKYREERQAKKAAAPPRS